MGLSFGRTRGLGLALGAALLMAGCAGPRVQTGRPETAGIETIDGASVELASFKNSAFPYHGLIPNYRETGKSRPFLDVDDNGRLGDSSSGRFWSPGGFAAFLSEAQTKLGDLYPSARGAFRRMPVVIVAYSGGYLPAAYSLSVGGDGARVRGVVLLDALYGEHDKFVRWAEGPGRNAFFLSAYSTSSQAGNEAVRSELEAAGVKTVTGLPQELSPGVVAFVDAGSVDHNDFVTSALGGAPLRDILSRIGG